MNLKFTDNRGTLYFPVKNNNFNFKQSTVSCNKKNIFRGIHINNFNKLVTCIQGKILDIIINFDKSASDYLKPKYYELDPTTNNFQIIVPKNYGHAFLSLEENSILIYHLEDEFIDNETQHIHFLDPFININLPIASSLFNGLYLLILCVFNFDKDRLLSMELKLILIFVFVFVNFSYLLIISVKLICPGFVKLHTPVSLFSIILNKIGKRLSMYVIDIWQSSIFS